MSAFGALRKNPLFEWWPKWEANSEARNGFCGTCLFSRFPREFTLSNSKAAPTLLELHQSLYTLSLSLGHSGHALYTVTISNPFSVSHLRKVLIFGSCQTTLHWGAGFRLWVRAWGCWPGTTGYPAQHLQMPRSSPGGRLGSLGTCFPQIIHQAFVTQLFRHFNGRDLIHLHSTVEAIVPWLGDILKAMTSQKTFDDPCTMLFRLFWIRVHVQARETFHAVSPLKRRTAKSFGMETAASHENTMKDLS